MQPIYQVLIRRKYALAIKVPLLMALILLCRLPVSADSLSLDNTVSLEASSQPLSLVLERLSQVSGKRIKYDETWADADISVKIVNQDLDKALRKILNNYNYAIIYADDGNIRIMVYGEKDATETAHNRLPVEYGHVGSADMQPEEPALENETEPDTGENAETDRQSEPEEDQKSVADDSEAVAESTETDTQETVDDDADRDDDQPRTLQTE